MKHTAPLTTLSLLALALSTSQSAQADEVLNFAPPSSEKTAAIAPVPVASPAPNSGILSFNPPSQEVGVRSQESGVRKQEINTSHPTPHTPHPTPQNLSDPFSGGANSLVAHAVGAAEGTRTPTGEKTPAYYGHKDPGNGVWNQGSFSYQHGAKTPEEADQKQLRRLAKQDAVLQQRAAVLGISYLDDLEVRLNGIDLANQAPLAAIAEDGGGYLDRLKQAQEMGLAGTDAVLWARVRSYLDPDTGRWNAPGLGNTVDRIAHDQERRMSRIAETLAVYQPPVAMAKPSSIQPAPPPAKSEEIADALISQDLSQSAMVPVEPPTQPETDPVTEQIIAQERERSAQPMGDSPTTQPSAEPLGFDFKPF